jgi:hypothetical protein
LLPDGAESDLPDQMMKVPPTLLLLLAIAPFPLGAEVLESLKTRAGREYFKVEVITNDDVGIRIKHEAGTARVPYGDLPDAMQSQYRADWKKAAAAKNEAAKAESERIKLEEEDRKQAEPEAKPMKPKVVPKESKPTTERTRSAVDKEVQKLDAHMTDLTLRAKEVLAEAAKLRREAEAERSKVRRHEIRNDGENRNSRPVPDKSGWAKATKYEEEAAALEGQAEKARALILEIKGKRDALKENAGFRSGS